MSIGTFQTTTIKELVANTKLELRLDGTTTQDVYIERYVRLCANEMKTQLDYVEETHTLEIENYQAELPCNFIKFDRPNPIVFTTNGVVDTDEYYSNWTPVYSDGAFQTCSPFNPERNEYGIPTVQIQSNKLQFSNNISATECTISGLFARLNEQGEMIIPALNKRTIVCGAAFMYNNSIGKPDLINAGFWQRGVSARRGESNQPDSLEQARLAFMWNWMP